MNDLAKNIILWIVIAIVLLSVFNNFATGPRVASTLDYSQFLDYVETGMVDDVRFDGREITGQLKSGGEFKTFSPETDNTAISASCRRAALPSVAASRRARACSSAC